MMKRASRALLVAGLVGAMIVPAAHAQDTQPLRVWVLSSFAQSALDAFDAVAQDFEAANPGIDVVIEPRGTDEHKDALRVTAGTAEEPDIYFMWAGLGLGGEFINLGVAAPLEDVYAEMDWNDRFTAPSLAKTWYGDHQYGVPYSNHGMILHYRKDAFEAAGITEEPTTYEELLAANDKLLAAGIQPIAFGGVGGWHLARLTDSLLETMCGAETHDALRSFEANWTEEPCATEAFNELAKWNEMGYLGEDFMGITFQDANLQVFTGDAAMMIEGDWMVQQIPEQSGEDTDAYGILPFPTGTDRLYFFAEMFYPAAASGQLDTAIDFLDLFSSAEVQQQFAGAFGAISTNKNVTVDNPSAMESEWVEIFDAAEQVYEPSDQAFPLDVFTEYVRIQDGIITGDVDPNEAAAQLQTFIDNR
jgi:raffinose/stachyose/melibiose transport system substrate-binding protein